MRITVRPRALLLAPAARDFVLRRARLALTRFAPKLGRVTVRVEDVNGPRGGEDKVCRVSATLPGSRPILVEARATTVGAAVHSAIGRAARAVARAISRKAA